jgi:hypothetical protein
MQINKQYQQHVLQQLQQNRTYHLIFKNYLIPILFKQYFHRHHHHHLHNNDDNAVVVVDQRLPLEHEMNYWILLINHPMLII